MNVTYGIKNTFCINAEPNCRLDTARLPEQLVLNRDCTLITDRNLTGEVIYRCEDKKTFLFEVRGTKTPGGDFLVMFPHGKHYGGGFTEKVNEMYAIRSRDGGKTWGKPVTALPIDYNQHGFIPLIPKGSSRIYCFGTQPVWGKWDPAGLERENAPIGYFYSDDDGFTWTGPTLIAPEEDPGYTGMSVMRMCETEKGTWLLGSHNGYYWSEAGITGHKFTLSTRLYILRSDDKGRSWHILPGKRDEGFQYQPLERMDEGRILSLGGDKAVMFCRTPQGHIFRTCSEDDGKTWSEPKPTSLIHPDAPPMVFTLSDGKTLVCFHHNRFHSAGYTGLDGSEAAMSDRSEIWVSFSEDEGITWSEPRFLFASVADLDFASPFHQYQCSYLDAVLEEGIFHLFVPHLWHEVLHLQIREDDLKRAATKAELFGGCPGKGGD